MPKALLSFIFIITCLHICAQDFSNKGKDFWVGYGTHVSMYGSSGVLNTSGGSQNMVLYFTSDQPANVKVEIPSTGWVRNYTVSPNTVTETVAIPKTGADDARLGTEGVSNKGIHITSDRPIVAYSHIYDGSVSGASILFPTNTLGRDYFTLGFTQTSNSAFSYPFCFVIATEDNTVVEVTPSAATLTHPAGVTFTETLQKGQILNLLGQLTGGTGGNQTGVDLTGTRIRSISSGTSGCKKIAVFCGTGKINIKCNQTGTASADNTIQQCFPSSAWGRKYITVPTRDMPNNFYRILVNNPNTVVKLNGSVLGNIVGGRYYQFQSSQTNIIEANEPIMVAEFITTANQCGNTALGTNGDPEMIYLSPIEQTLNRVTLNSTSKAAINANNHYINVVTKAAGVNSFRFDGNNISSSFLPLPGDPSFSYTQIKTTAGVHNLVSDSGFNAIAYGYGSAESYGYNAGTNVVDLYQFVTLQNQFATVNFPATCKNTPFYYAITLPYLPTSLTWDFANNPNLSPNTPVVNNAPIPDSTYTRDGRTLYIFKLPGTYTFSAAGTYPIKVIANNPSPDGCSGVQEIDYDVEVFEAPKADFNVSHTGCLLDTAFFTENSNSFGRPIVKWKWEFGDNTTDTIKNPVKRYQTSGNYNVKLQVISDIGCISDTTKPVVINPEPIANFGVLGAKCVNSTLTFSDSSTIPQGSIVKWVWDFGDGTGFTATNNNSPLHSYPTPGNYVVKLQVEGVTGCKSNIYTRTITISATPVVDFSMPIICLPAGTGQFFDLSSIADGTTAAFTYSWNFGDGGTDSVKNPLHRFTSTGPFNVKLTVTSGAGCIKDTTKTFRTIYDAPNANFNFVNANNEVCLRDTTLITDASNGNGNTIVEWKWLFGDGTADTVQNPRHLYLSAGTFKVKLVTKNDKGCVSDTAGKDIIVMPLPIANFRFSNPTCEGQDITITDQSSPQARSLNSWNWSFGDGTTAIYTNSNPFQKRYTTAGTYDIKLVVTTTSGCKSDTASKTINVNKTPTAHFLLPNVCLSDAFAQFTDSSYATDGSTPFSYSWNFGDPNATPANPNTSSAINGRHKYSAPGSYDVTLTITNVNGCTSTTTRSFFVNGSVPKANFTVVNGGNLCSNLPVQIQNTSTVDFGNVTKIEIVWDVAGLPTAVFTDNSPVSGKFYSHTYPALQTTRTYQVKLRAYSGGSCVSELEKSVTVNASPKVLFTTMPGICLDAIPRQITQASETGAVPGNSIFSGPGVSSGGVFNPVSTGAGNFAVQYLYTSTAGCKDSATQSITVWPQPTARWGFSNPTCETGAITFTDSSLANFSNLTRWNWDFKDGTTSNLNSGAPFNKTFAAAGMYNVSLQVVTDSGCKSQVITKPIDVHPLPRVDFSLPIVCLPAGAAQFFDSSKIADGTESQFNYVWDFGDPANPTTSNNKNPVHNYSSQGPFAVKLTVTSVDGCSATATKQLTTVFQPPIADFTSAPPEACLGTTFVFTDNSTGTSGNITRWSWSFGDGTTSISQNASRKYTTANTYGVALTVENDKGCLSATTTKNVIVHSFPVVNAGPDLMVLEGGSAILDATASGNNLSFNWTPSTYLDNPNLKTPRTTPVSDITYKLTVTAQGGCSRSDEVFVKVLKAPTIPSAFSPNGDGINDVWNIKYLESYPGSTVEIFDRYGQLVFKSNGYSKAWDGTSNGSVLPVGTYYYIINPKNGRNPYSGSVTILR